MKAIRDYGASYSVCASALVCRPPLCLPVLHLFCQIEYWWNSLDQFIVRSMLGWNNLDRNSFQAGLLNGPLRRSIPGRPFIRRTLLHVRVFNAHIQKYEPDSAYVRMSCSGFLPRSSSPIGLLPLSGGLSPVLIIWFLLSALWPNVPLS